jgi:hypothetical protein
MEHEPVEFLPPLLDASSVGALEAQNADLAAIQSGISEMENGRIGHSRISTLTFGSEIGSMAACWFAMRPNPRRHCGQGNIARCA